VATIHRVRVSDPGPPDPWYYEPVGTGRWDHLVELLLEAGAPSAGGLADLRDELVALKAIVGQIIAAWSVNAGGLILGSLGPIR
jgi:hypothetical protein